MTQQDSAAAVVLAGGQGTRLWPLSRARRPKQFHEFTGGSLLSLTVERVAAHVARSRIYVSTTSDLVTAVHESGCDVGSDRMILESSPAGPATAFILGLVRVHAELGDVPTLVCPSDHYFACPEAVHAALREMFASEAVGEQRPVVMGVAADKPNTRLGYFRAAGTGSALDVTEMLEKPSVATAEELIADGDWFWNTACYLVRPSSAIAAYRASHPEAMEVILREALSGDPYGGPPIPGHELFPFFEGRCLPRLVVLPKGWSDVGSWESFLAVDETVASAGSGECVQVASAGTAVFNQTGRVVVTVGTKDLVVVVDDDAIFLLDRDAAVDPHVLSEARSTLEDQGRGNLL